MSTLLSIVVSASTNAALYTLVACSLVLVYRCSGVVNFAVGHVAVVSGIFYANTQLGGVTGLLLSMVVGALLGLGIYALAIAPINFTGGSPAVMAIATLGVGMIMAFAAGRIWAKEAFGRGPIADGSTSVLGVNVSHQRLVIIGLAAVCFILVALLLERTMVGWMLEAVAFNPTIAQLSGVRPALALAVTWTLAGALAALAGSLQASFSSVSLPVTLSITILGFAAAVVGGINSTSGAVIGAVVIAFSQTLLIMYVSSQYANVICYGLLFLMLALRPQGIVRARRQVSRA